MKIALLGDIALFGKMSVNENPKLNDYFAEVSEHLKSFDYVVGNLETPFSISQKINGAKSAYICSDVENVQILKQLHVNAVCLSNNHMFDYGKEGYETTKKLLENNSIEWFGAEGKELKIVNENNKIAFSGFCCYSSNPLQCVPYGKYGVNAFNVETV
jgi:poly-gamma-glutamate synthesis protein (capsule biosynthesis protein)